MSLNINQKITFTENILINLLSLNTLESMKYSTSRRFVHARQILFYTLHVEIGLPGEEIARLYPTTVEGSRTKGSVYKSSKIIIEELKSPKGQHAETKNVVSAIKNQIND